VEQRPEFSVFDSHKKWYPTGFVGASLSIPLFDGLQKHSRIDQAKLSLKKTKNDLENITNALYLECVSGRTMMMNAIASLTTQEKNVDLANEVYTVSKLKYEQGVGSNLEVINAETSLKEAQTNYYNALYDALVAKVDLDKALGNIK
jgi:outer membrane protein TolC